MLRVGLALVVQALYPAVAERQVLHRDWTSGAWVPAFPDAACRPYPSTSRCADPCTELVHAVRVTLTPCNNAVERISGEGGSLFDNTDPCAITAREAAPMKMTEAFELLRTVSYQCDAGSANVPADERRVRYELVSPYAAAAEKSMYYDGHQYARFAPDAMVADYNWVAARGLCADMAWNGRVGYLSTVTSEEELAAVLEMVGGNDTSYLNFMGATDTGEEGVWRWVTGPEGCPQQYDLDNPVVAHRSGCDLGLGPQYRDASTGCDEMLYPHCLGGERVADFFWRQDEPGHPSGDPEDFGLIGADVPLDFVANSFMGFVCEWGGVGAPCVADVRSSVLLVGSMAEDECEGNCNDGIRTCRDPDYTEPGNWECSCPDDPGSFVPYQVPDCFRNECTADCASCANGTCRDESQSCVDPLPQRIEDDKDWYCECRQPYALFGPKRLAVAADCRLSPSPPSPSPPTASPPTASPPTASPPTASPPTASPPTASPPTASPPTASPPTPVPPTPVPPVPPPVPLGDGVASPTPTPPPLDPVQGGLPETDERSLEKTSEVVSTLSLFSGMRAMNAPKLAVARDFGCNVDDVDLAFGEPIDFEFSPTGVAVGSGPSRYFIGAIVMNTVLIVGFAAVVAAAARLVRCCMGCSEDESLGLLKSPGALVTPFMFLLPGVALSATRLLFAPDQAGAGYAVLGAVVMILCSATPAFLHWKVLRHLKDRAYVEPDPRLAPVGAEGDADVKPVRRWLRGPYRFVFGDSVWVSRGGASRFCEKFGVVFDSYREGMTWMLLAEICVNLTLAFIAGWKPGSSGACTARNVFISAMFVGFVALCAWKRPFLAAVDNLVMIVNNLLTAVALTTITIAIAVEANPATSDAYRVAFYCLLLSAIIVVTKGAWDLLAYLLDVVLGRRAEARSRARKQDGAGLLHDVPGLEMSDRTSNTSGGGKGALAADDDDDDDDADANATLTATFMKLGNTVTHQDIAPHVLIAEPTASGGGEAPPLKSPVDGGRLRAPSGIHGNTVSNISAGLSVSGGVFTVAGVRPRSKSTKSTTSNYLTPPRRAQIDPLNSADLHVGPPTAPLPELLAAPPPAKPAAAPFHTPPQEALTGADLLAGVLPHNAQRGRSSTRLEM